MPCILTPQRKVILKNSLLKNRGAKQALLDAGFSPVTAGNSTSVKAVKICQAEITAEIDKRGLAKRAYNTLDDNLTAPERPVQVAAAATILRFTDNDSRFKLDLLPEAEKMEFESLRQKVSVDITPQADDQQYQ